jgi:hypothetical protein
MTYLYGLPVILACAVAWTLGFKRELLVLLCLVSIFPLWGVIVAETKASWEILLESLSKDKKAFEAAMQESFSLLAARAEKENKALLAHLTSSPPLPNKTMLHEQKYELASLATHFREDIERAQALVKSLHFSLIDLTIAVDDYLFLRARLLQFTAHISHHAHLRGYEGKISEQLT